MRKQLFRISTMVIALVVMSCMYILNAQADLATASVRDGDTYLGRAYNADFDKVFDNFERPTITGLAGTGLWWAVNENDSAVSLTEPHLQADYSTTVGTTKDAPIYKVASASNTNGAYDFLVLNMKLENGASFNDLVISFRYDDNHSDIDVNFTDLVDPQLQPLTPIDDGAYHVYIIDLLNTLDGKTFDLIPGKQGPATIDAGKTIVGFHILSKTSGTGAGTVDFKEIYWSKDPATQGFVDNTDNFLLDNFMREDLSATDANVYWRGGGDGSQIIGKWLAVDYTSTKASFREAGYDNSNVTGTYDNVVLRIKGTVGGENLILTPFYVVNGVDTYGTPINYSDLKGPDDQIIPALTTSFQNVVVNFANNGWDKAVNGFKIESQDGQTGLVYIDTIFFTNMQYDASTIQTVYPIIDPNNILIFDDFDRSTLGATAEYDASNQVAIDNGLTFIIGYAGMDRMSIENGNLVMDASVNHDYIQYTTGGNYINDGSYKYVVFKVKGTDEATLDNFRLSTIDTDGARSSVVWGNGGLKSGSGLRTPDFTATDYPYVTEDGYMYLIVDLAASNLTTTVSGFDLYFGGQGKLYIDSIFFANDGNPILDTQNSLMFDDFNRDALVPADLNTINKWYLEGANASILDNALVLDSTNSAHAYYKTGGYPNNFDTPKQYLVLKMKGDEGTTLDSFRINTNDGTADSAERFANQGQLVSFPGIAIPALTTEYQTYIIDLDASGLQLNAQGLTISFGDWGQGKIYIDEISFSDSISPVASIETTLASLSTDTTTTTDNSGDTTDNSGTTDNNTGSTTDNGNSTDQTQTDVKDHSELSTGIIATIVIAGVAVVVGSGFIIRKRR